MSNIGAWRQLNQAAERDVDGLPVPVLCSMQGRGSWLLILSKLLAMAWMAWKMAFFNPQACDFDVRENCL